MTQDEIKKLAGHREVSPWVMKLVGDAVAKEREAVVDIAQSYCGRLVHEEEFQKEIRARGNT